MQKPRCRLLRPLTSPPPARRRRRHFAHLPLRGHLATGLQLSPRLSPLDDAPVLLRVHVRGWVLRHLLKKARVRAQGLGAPTEIDIFG